MVDGPSDQDASEERCRARPISPSVSEDGHSRRSEQNPGPTRSRQHSTAASSGDVLPRQRYSGQVKPVTPAEPHPNHFLTASLAPPAMFPVPVIAYPYAHGGPCTATNVTLVASVKPAAQKPSEKGLSVSDGPAIPSARPHDIA